MKWVGFGWGIGMLASLSLAQSPADVPSVWTSAKVKEAAGKIALAQVTTFALTPDAETARLAEPPAPDLSADTDSDTAAATRVQAVEDSHFRIKIREHGYQNWFLIHLTGVPAGGKTVRFDVENAAQSQLRTFNPQFSYATDLSALATYAEVPNAAVTMLNGSAGAVIPDGPGLPWRFIPATWRSSPTDLSFVHRFEKDCYVALRVPYTLGYHAAFVESLAGRPNVMAHKIDGGDNVPDSTIIEIGNDEVDVRRRNPCVVIYSREDGDQQDGSWFIEGAARALLAETPQAKAARERCTFLLIPIIDAQAVDANHWTYRAMYFANPEGPQLTAAYKVFFAQWVADGHRLDLAVDLFTPESAETPHLSYVGINGVLANKVAACRALEKAYAATDLYSFAAKPGADKDQMANRLVGHLRDAYGATPLLFFVNAQDKTRHLTLDELRRMGGLFAETSAAFLNSPEAAGVLKTADAKRQAKAVQP